MSQDMAKEKTINGHVYMVYPLPPRAAFKVLKKLLHIVGPALTQMVALNDASGMSVATGLAMTVEGLMQRWDEEEIDSIMMQLAEKSTVDNKPLKQIFDAHFAGKMGEMTAWMKFAIEAQFGNFTEGWEGDSNPAEFLTGMLGLKKSSQAST